MGSAWRCAPSDKGGEGGIGEVVGSGASGCPGSGGGVSGGGTRIGGSGLGSGSSGFGSRGSEGVAGSGFGVGVGLGVGIGTGEGGSTGGFDAPSRKSPGILYSAAKLSFFLCSRLINSISVPSYLDLLTILFASSKIVLHSLSLPRRVLLGNRGLPVQALRARSRPSTKRCAVVLGALTLPSSVLR